MRNKKILYELIFTILAIIAVSITFLDISEKIVLAPGSALYYIDLIILFIFIIDYFVRFYIAENKKVFFKNNIPDLIAIFPFNSMFKAFRVVKLFRLVKLSKFMRILKLSRLLAFLSKLHRNSKKFLRTNGLIYSLYFAILVILLGAFGIHLTENRSFSDSLWWAFVTATTVGYGDISPTTIFGRVIAVLLMIVGIGTIGMLTGTVATFFLKAVESPSDSYPFEKYISETTDFTDEEKKMLIEYAIFLKSRRKTI